MTSTAPSTSDYSAFLAAVNGSPAMAPYAWALRVLTDPRTKPERIRAAVWEHIGAFRYLPQREITTPLVGRIAKKLRETSLAAPPCDRAVRKYVRKYLEQNGTSGGDVPHNGCGVLHASTICST